MQEQKLEAAKGDIGEAREESEKLKFLLATNHNHEESELVTLSLGISSQGKPTSKDEKKDSNRTQKRENEDVDIGLALGLDVRFDPAPETEAAISNFSQESSSTNEKGKEEEPAEMWPPSKVLKTMRTGDKSTEANSQHAHQLKKTRVSIRARCDSPTVVRN